MTNKSSIASDASLQGMLATEDFLKGIMATLSASLPTVETLKGILTDLATFTASRKDIPFQGLSPAQDRKCEADLLALAKEAVEETLKVGPAYAKANFWNVMNSRTFRRFESWKLDGERIYEMNAGISRRFQSNPCLHSF